MLHGFRRLVNGFVSVYDAVICVLRKLIFRGFKFLIKVDSEVEKRSCQIIENIKKSLKNKHSIEAINLILKYGEMK